MSIPISVYSFPAFRGVNFKDAPLNVPPPFSRRAKFVEFDLLGAVSKAKGPARINAAQIQFNPAILGLYEYIQNDGDKFLIAVADDQYTYKVSYADGTITDISGNYVYPAANRPITFITTGDLCILSDGVSRPMYVSGGVTTSDWFYLGLTAPSVAPTAALGAAGVLTGDYSYKTVFVSPNGAKSNASGASNTVTTTSDQVNVTTIDVYAGNTENVTKRELYRTRAGGSVYYFLTEIADNVTASFVDNVPDSQLGARLVEEREVPPDGLMGLTEYNGYTYGFVRGEHDLRYSQINEPQAWGAFNIEPIVPGNGQPITALGRLNRLVVFKSRSLHTWEGIPGLFVRREKSNVVGCVAHNTVKNISLPQGGDVLMFLASTGVYAFDEQDVFSVSREIETIFNGRDENYTFNAARAEFSCAEYLDSEKKYFLSIPVNGSSDNNLMLVYDVYAQSWSVREPFYCGAISLRTRSDSQIEVVGGDSRDDVTNGGYVFTIQGDESIFETDYLGEYVTSWNDLGAPNNNKLLRYIEVDLIAEGDYQLFVDIYVDGDDTPQLTLPMSLSIGGGIWDVSNWDEVDYAGATFITAKEGLARVQGRFFSLGFRTNLKDQPWKVLRTRIEHQVLPNAGDRK